MRGPILKSKPDAFGKVAGALGHITIEWSRIERMLDDLIIELARLDGDQVGPVVTGNIDIRSKIQMAKGLAFIRKPNDEWLVETIKTLDHVDNVLRPRRNDLIHAQWGMPNNKLIKITSKTKIRKPQSFQVEMESRQEITVSVKELALFRTELEFYWMRILFISLSIMRQERAGGSNPLRSISLQELLHQARLDTLPRYVRSKPRSQQKSSRR